MSQTMTIVHCTPTPYRVHLFGALSRHLTNRGWHLHVHFLAATSSGRPHWLCPERIPFAHTFWQSHSLSQRARGVRVHPRLLLHLRSKPPDALYVWAPYDTLGSLLLSGFAPGGVRLCHIEPNTRTPGAMRGPRHYLKLWALRRYRYVVVPGIEGHRWLDLVFGPQGSRPESLTLPNLVDELRFRPRWDLSDDERSAARERLGVPEGKRMALWPARLIPEKGVPEFLGCVEARWLQDWLLVILGEGPLLSRVQHAISESGLNDHVRLVPPLAYEDMPSLYAAADLFVLPSLDDPCPLSVVEASHCGLPLLLSDRVGNYPEGLEPGVNGWGLDPGDPASVRASAEAAFTASSNGLDRMGRASHSRAQQHWTTDTCVRGFLDALGI